MASEFTEIISNNNMAPLWEVLRGLTPREPLQKVSPTHWRSETIKANMMLACEFISAEDAERRVLVLENEQLRGKSLATNSLYAGIQMILPGEVAPSHRHTASALRLILSGERGYTTVDGDKVFMTPGDFIITPTGVFHDHGAEGSEPVMWLDGLDVPLVQMLNCGFSADDPKHKQEIKYPADYSSTVFSNGLRPVSPELKRPYGTGSIFHYPYDRTRKTLKTMEAAGQLDPCDGIKMTFTDPTTGLSPILTMSAFMQLLPEGFSGQTFQETDGAVCCVIEGSVNVVINGETRYFKQHDVFMVPSWSTRSYESQEGCILFSFSDRCLQEHLGFWQRRIINQ